MLMLFIMTYLDCILEFALDIFHSSGCRGRDCMVIGFLTTYMQSVPITTIVVSLNLAQVRCTRYNIM